MTVKPFLARARTGLRRRTEQGGTLGFDSERQLFNANYRQAAEDFLNKLNCNKDYIPGRHFRQLFCHSTSTPRDNPVARGQREDILGTRKREMVIGRTFGRAADVILNTRDNQRFSVSSLSSLDFMMIQCSRYDSVGGMVACLVIICVRTAPICPTNAKFTRPNNQISRFSYEKRIL